MAQKSRSGAGRKKAPAKKKSTAKKKAATGQAGASVAEVLSEIKTPMAVDQMPKGGSLSDISGRQSLTPIDILGRVNWLMLWSPVHKHLSITDLEWLILPPIQYQQFRLFQKDGVPVGFVSWAFLSEEADTRYSTGVRKLQPGDWKSGNELWLVDLVAPFGGAEEMIGDLRTKILSGQIIKTLQPHHSGQGIQVATWHPPEPMGAN